MKLKSVSKIIAIVGCAVFLTACSGSEEIGEDELKIETSAKDYEGEDYEDVISQLEDNGFHNVETEKMEDLITGWLTKDGEVEKISVDGETDFAVGDIFSKDAKVIVTYHTFSDNSEDESSGTINNSIEDNEPDILTAENNEDLAKLLIVAAEDPYVGEFAAKYAGRTIEFDGCIAYMNNHNNYKTRYDFLVYACDYSLTSAPGPSFQFNDVNFNELNLTGSDYISAGFNLHIVAEVQGYNEMGQILYLNPISTEVR